MANVNIPLLGIGVDASYSLTPMDAIDFGMVMVNQTSPPRTLMINNTGDGAITVDKITVAGAPFKANMASPISIAQGKSAKVDLTFTPGMIGDAKGTITLSVVGLNATKVDFKRKGVAPNLGVAPSTLDFGGVAVGMPLAVQTVTLKNSGNGSLTIDPAGIVSTDEQFAVDLAGAQLTLSNGGTTSFKVTFTPARTGAASGEIQITLKGQTQPAIVIGATGDGVFVDVFRGKGCACAVGGRRAGVNPLAALLAAIGLCLALRRRSRTRLSS